MNRFGKYFMEKNRLETLIDGIFAIVMTLLVMTVVVPQRETVIQSTGFMEMLRLKVHDIVNYALSFSLLAIFWIQHHEQAHFIKRTNPTHIWINILTLFFIALFPFSTSLVSEFGREHRGNRVWVQFIHCGRSLLDELDLRDEEPAPGG